jgi:hypothetical protein
VLTVTVNARQATLAIGKVKSNIDKRRPLLEAIGSRIVAYTRETINMQGRTGWKPLAASTQISTGRSKALTPLIPFIKYRVNNRYGVTVYFSKRPARWNLEMHERGFTSRAVKGVLMKAVRLGKFSSRKASVIPGRRVWPTVAVTEQITADLTRDWIINVTNRGWR